MLRRNIKNLAFQTAGQILPRVIMFVSVLYIARLLGSVEYGKFEFAMSIGYLLGMFFELGGNMILTKHIARNNYSSFYYGLRIRVYSILGVLTIFYAILFIFDLYAEGRLYIIYASIGIAFSSLMNLYFAFFRGVRKMGYEAVVLTIQKCLFAGIALILIYSSAAASQPLIAFLLSMAAGFLIIFLIFTKKKGEYSFKKESYEKLNFKSYAMEVLVLGLVEVFSNIYYRINQIFIEHYRGFEEVGIYGAAYKIIEALINFPSIILIVLFPVFAKLAADNLNEFKRQFDKILLMLTGFGLAAGAVCWIAGDFIFNFIGADYERSDEILRYLSFSLIFLFPNYIITQGLIALNKNAAFAKILFAALLLNVALSIILVPKFGAAGTAISITICEMLIFICGIYFVKKYSNKVEQKT